MVIYSWTGTYDQDRPLSGDDALQDRRKETAGAAAPDTLI